MQRRRCLPPGKVSLDAAKQQKPYLCKQIHELDGNETAEGYGTYHIKRFHSDQQIDEDHDDCALIDGYDDPVEDRLRAQLVSRLSRLVQHWVLESYFAGDIFIQDQRKYGKHRKYGGVAEQKDTVVDWKGHEEELDREDRLHYRDDEPAVDDELREEGTTLVCQPSVP